MKWTLINPAGTNDPDTGDIYSGLDRFGRVKDNRWLDGAGADLDRIQYGYDRAGNRIWRRNVVAAALGKEFDELYGYDAIHRLKEMQRGLLNSERTALNACGFAQCWTLDSTGNWQGFREDDDGNGTWDLIQQRSANPVNEISGISETAGPSWVTPAYSRAGNMTTLPQPANPTESYTATYDAWNRLVKIADGADTVAEYQYDGARRRIVQKSYTGGVLDEARHLYYTEPSWWQVIEERIGTSADAERQFIWGRQYIDDLVLRDRDTDNNGSFNERIYTCQDAKWNVTAIVDSAGDALERFAYTAYGMVTELDSEFVPSPSLLSIEYLYSGYRSQATTQLYHVRHRVYHSSLGEWGQRDPLHYASGMSLYNSPSTIRATDPYGLQYGEPPQNPFNAGGLRERCNFVMNDITGRNGDFWWEREANTIGGPVVVDVDQFGDILNGTSRCGACTINLIGHRGNHLGFENPGGIETDTGRILPNPDFETELRQVFERNGCRGCRINIVACGSQDARATLTLQWIAYNTGCMVCGATEMISPGYDDSYNPGRHPNGGGGNQAPYPRFQCFTTPRGPLNNPDGLVTPPRPPLAPR